MEKKIMEEKSENAKPKKLTYEQLEQAAKQISQQADALYKENQQLKNAVQQLSNQASYTELNFRFRVLENHTHFSKEFVTRIVKEIEETMTPMTEDSSEKEKTDETEETKKE